jgi:hypothetical protein
VYTYSVHRGLLEGADAGFAATENFNDRNVQIGAYLRPDLDIFVVKISCSSEIPLCTGSKCGVGVIGKQYQQSVFKNGVHKWGGSKNSLMGATHQSKGDPPN